MSSNPTLAILDIPRVGKKVTVLHHSSTIAQYLKCKCILIIANITAMAPTRILLLTILTEQEVRD